MSFVGVDAGENIASNWDEVPHSRDLDGMEMSSLTSSVARIPAGKPIGPIIMHISRTGIET